VNRTVSREIRNALIRDNDGPAASALLAFAECSVLAAAVEKLFWQPLTLKSGAAPLSKKISE
jgi:hypothetical protein